jgi:hypothetical protein
MSASSYGVTNTGWPPVADLSCASQVLAAWLAGWAASGCEPRQPAAPPVRYGLLMVAALLSRAGSIAQVRCALPA